jgi:predicted RNA-binding Zn ribbon-like protein
MSPPGPHVSHIIAGGVGRDERFAATGGSSLIAGLWASSKRYLRKHTIRYGSTMSVRLDRPSFDFGANHLALDFTNTVSGRPQFARDDLAGPEDFLDWARAAGIVNHTGQTDEITESRQRFDTAIALRENLYRVFGPVAGGGVPHEPSLAFVVRRAAQATRSAQWDRTNSGFVPHWSADSIAAICDRLADEAIQLLRSPSVARVGSCAGCGWLFLDVSRAHARRWCSMNVCGVRDKMRRYHQRQTHAAGFA